MSEFDVQPEKFCACFTSRKGIINAEYKVIAGAVRMQLMNVKGKREREKKQ